MTGLAQLRARLATDQPARAYLLSIDPGHGRAIVAVGDPDRGANVLTFVPGTSESMGSLDRLMERADRMAEHAGGTAVVTWLGYDPPADIPAAAGTGSARRAEADLARFAAGVRATHADGPVHHTVLGHSYGSLVIGMTAHDRGLDVDDAIFVGSPGVGVDRAGDLGLPVGHVWSSTARTDPIEWLRAGSGARDPFVLGRTGPADGQWFGADPSSARFGGHVFTADPGDPRHPAGVHSAYFDEGNAALDNIARIAVGDTDRVR
jgi:pimeloyl-ACP methyl ester carboxylesterase